MSLGVILGYPMMVCSQGFRVYRRVISTRLYRNDRKSTNPILWNLSCSYTTAYAMLSTLSLLLLNAPLAFVLAANLSYMGLWVPVNMRTRVGICEELRFCMECVHYYSEQV